MNRELDQKNVCNQLNFDGTQRNAGRDYIEYFAINNIKLYLMCTPEAELDRIALNNPGMFKCRFGFAPPTTIREQVINIRHQYDLTDSQVRWLRYSGILKISAKEAKLAPSRLMMIVGWIQLVIVSLVCSSMLLQISYPTSIVPAWKQLLGCLFICGYWVSMAWPICKLYVNSWYVLKRAGATGLQNL